ncbi:hypothetical protein [Macrococcus capreoli]|uniref:hypothetical protein n=1 Tax=Macrococcus capreoli TaxID=2982690 RepID=UPI0021D57C89|nr:hypothetical protein [Macrococcus sp. TMW 2.2395]MCU7556591.1 hypothetical protein [Macrococcus sp. TMW 2.2395]
MDKNNDKSFDDVYLDLLNRLELEYDNDEYKNILIKSMNDSPHNNSTLADLLGISEGAVRKTLNPKTELPPSARLAAYLLLADNKRKSTDRYTPDLRMDKLTLLKYIMDLDSSEFDIELKANDKAITIFPVIEND